MSKLGRPRSESSCRRNYLESSGQKLLNHVSSYVSETEFATHIFIGQPSVVKAQAVQQRGLQVVNVDGILHDVQTIIIRFTHHLTSFDSTSSHPHAVSIRVVVASGVVGVF